MRTGRRFVCLLCILFLLALVSPASATEFKSGDRIAIPEGTTIADELYAFGQSFVLNGRVTNDTTVFASEVRVAESGSIGGSANLAGQTVNVAGRVTNNLRAAGNTVTVAAPVGANAALAGSFVTIAGAGSVGRDLFAAGSDVDIQGRVGRNLKIAAEKATVNATVGGDVRIDANQVVIGPEAVIRGDLIYTSPARATIDPAAQITGRTVHRARAEKEDGFGALRWFLWAAGFLALLLVGMILLAVAPNTMLGAANTAFRSPWISLLIGFVFLVVFPVLIGILMFTLIGVPLALILLAMYLILLYVSRIVTALAIGNWLFGRLGRTEVSRYAAFFVGLLIFWILTAIPKIGPLISLIGLLLGLGALLWERYNFIRQMRTEGRL